MNSISKSLTRMSTAIPRSSCLPSRLPSSSSFARHASSSATAATPPSSTAAPPPASPIPTDPTKTHYLVTLLRSPLHLPAPIKATCQSLGLGLRLSSSIVPITRENAGYILRIKELVGVRSVGVEEVAKASTTAWRAREGEGRKGKGLVMQAGKGTIRIGRERARGEERGFRVVKD